MVRILIKNLLPSLRSMWREWAIGIRAVALIAVLMGTSCGMAPDLAAPAGESTVTRISSGASGEVRASVGDAEVVIDLNSYGEGETAGVEVAAVELGRYIMVRSSDPEGRYLPSVTVRPKSSAEAANVEVLQTPVDYEWSVRYLGEIDTAVISTSPLAEVAFSAVVDSLSNAGIEGEVTVILPANRHINESETVTVYETHLSGVFLIAPGEETSTVKSARVVGLTEVVSISVRTLLTFYESYRTVTEVVDTVRKVAVPDLVGHRPDSDFASWRIWAYQYGLKFNFRETTCEDSALVGRVVRQVPQGGSTAHLFKLNEGITLFVCRTLMVSVPSVEGMTGPEARELVVSRGLRYVLEVPSEDCRRGDREEGYYEALYTDPDTGATVEAGTPIALYVCWVQGRAGLAQEETTPAGPGRGAGVEGDPQDWLSGIESLFPNGVEPQLSGEYANEVFADVTPQLDVETLESWGRITGYFTGAFSEDACASSSWIGVTAVADLYKTSAGSQSFLEWSSSSYSDQDSGTVPVGDFGRYFYLPGRADENCGPDFRMDILEVRFVRLNTAAWVRVTSAEDSRGLNESLAVALSVARGIDENILESSQATGPSATDYSDLDQFGRSLKDAIENGEYEALAELATDPVGWARWESGYTDELDLEDLSQFLDSYAEPHLDISEEARAVADEISALVGLESFTGPVFVLEDYAVEREHRSVTFLVVASREGRFYLEGVIETIRTREGDVPRN